MGLWSRLMRRKNAGDATVERAEAAAEPRAGAAAIELPREPFVFECQECGKVFEARRRRPGCPECDSSNVSVVSD